MLQMENMNGKLLLCQTKLRPILLITRKMRCRLRQRCARGRWHQFNSHRADTFKYAKGTYLKSGIMNYQRYLALFDEIMKSDNPEPPYTNPKYVMYVKLNHSRMTRWWKILELNEVLVDELKKINRFQQWIILAEPWCGDAAPTVPFLVRLAAQNPLIHYDLQLRDEEPFLINAYLTNGAKSIPKLIVRDEQGNDLFTWGPRPRHAQQLVNELRAAHTEYETLSIQLQNWYNKDKGVELQEELLQLFRSISVE